ncbi:MAG: hypothetical protein DRH23_05895 [Deltaproteobacteria bacterium]|nr:hypothetical protein [Deltaproteobacteria bacterium]MBW2223370.1 hypothetical protein [Deltaproteobacteria bacterium]MBW2402495.1 hypothetical protein [Deltaproteobacteria bacterium]MBW2717877.1 hypothetical protein [Deltaproteobacteria bacterium]RLB49746.1 MAG: hypothetical protein DRH23_05895 [Deltaproteobacteria bacterium]
MFVGHYAPSFALRRTGGVPLWVLFLAVQFVDVLRAFLILAGVEKVRIIEGFTAASPLDLYYMPYTHSLTASIGWALALGWIGSLIWRRRGGVVIGLCVISHWILDLPVHVANLPLWGNELKVGFGLWNHPVIAFVLEAGVLLTGVAIYARHARSKVPIWIFAIVLLGIQYSNSLMPVPESARQLAVMALASYFGFAMAAWYVEKKWGQQPDTGHRWDTLHPGGG